MQNESDKLTPQTLQQSSPDTPQYEGTQSFPTPAHPMPKKLPKWLLVFLVLIPFSLLLHFLYSELLNTPNENTSNLTDTTTPRVTAPPTGNISWKTYQNTALGFSFKYPDNLQIRTEGARPEHGADWELQLDYNADKITNPSDPNKFYEHSIQRYEAGYYSIRISIVNNSDLSIKSTRNEKISRERLYKLGSMQAHVDTRDVQERPAIRYDTTFIVGDTDKLGGGVDLYILDGDRLIRHQATSYNYNEVSLEKLHEIISTFTFLSS